MSKGFQWRIGQVGFAQEGTFATDPGAKTYIELTEKPSIDGAGRQYFEADHMKQGTYEEPGVIGHQSESTLSLSFYNHGYEGQAGVPSNAPTAAHPDSELVSLAVGDTVFHDAGGGGAFIELDGVTSIDTTTTLDVAAGGGAQFVGGECVAVQTANGWECAHVKTIATDKLTLRAPLSSDTEGADLTVFGGINVYPSLLFRQSSVAVDMLNQLTADVVRLLGGRPTSLKGTFNPRDFGKWQMDFLFNTCARTGPTGPAAYQTYVDGSGDTYPREEIMGGKLRIYDGSNLVALDCSSFEFDLGLETIQYTDPVNGQGAGDPVRGMVKPRFTFNPLMSSDAPTVQDGGTFDPAAAFAAKTSFDIRYEMGTQPGRLTCLHAPAARLVVEPVVSDRDGLVSYQLVFAPMAYTGDTGSGLESDLIDKDFLISWL